MSDNQTTREESVAPEVKTTRVRVRVDTSDLPPMTYTNHLVAHFTGSEIVLYGSVVERELPSQAVEAPPKELNARVQARWVMPPDRFLDHILRSVDFIDRNPVLGELYRQMKSERSEES